MSFQPNDPTRVLLINGYSASNRGDGLLVKLGAELVREAFPHNNLSITAAVQDTDSFKNWTGFDTISTFGPSSGIRLAVRGIAALLTIIVAQVSLS